MMEAIASLGIIGYALIFIVALVWFFLPFAIFGIKGYLAKLINAQQETNRLLRRLADQADPIEESDPNVHVSRDGIKFRKEGARYVRYD